MVVVAIWSSVLGYALVYAGISGLKGQPQNLLQLLGVPSDGGPSNLRPPGGTNPGAALTPGGGDTLPVGQGSGGTFQP